MNDITVYTQNQIQQKQTLRADMFNSFIAYLDTSEKTVQTYTRALKQLFKYLAINNIQHPQRADILAFRDDLKATGKKPTTVQNYITATKIFFKWTDQEGLYPNIAENIKGAKLNRDHKKDYLTATQAKEIINSIDTSTLKGLRDYAIIVLMTTGGLRTIEVSRANIEDLRTIGGNTVLFIQGKGKEEKTDYVKISPQVEKAIRAYLRDRGKTSEDSPLFASTSNNNKGKRLTTRTISGIVKETFKKAGYDSDRLTAHSLRHTAVTLSLLAGKDITEVQQFARHANISTTMIYNHSLDKAKNTCSEAITEVLF